MQKLIHQEGSVQIVEINADKVLIESAQDALDLFMSLSAEGYDKIILHQACLTPRFFQLSNGLAGEILQKVTNYRLQLAIVGDFNQVSSESLQAFIRESNRGRQNFFLNDVPSAIQRLSAHS